MTASLENSINQTAHSAILEHVARYRLSVAPALIRLGACRRLGRKRLKAVLTELCNTGQLSCGILYPGRDYYCLGRPNSGERETPGEAASSGISAGPLSETNKIRQFAMLGLCCLSDVHRQRLTVENMRTHFAEPCRPGLAQDYYIDVASAKPRLGFTRVDHGGHGRWDRVLAKCRQDLEAHWQAPQFRPFVDRDELEFTLITALAPKAERLRQAIAAWNDPRSRMIRIAVLPELLNLIAPPPIPP